MKICLWVRKKDLSFNKYKLNYYGNIKNKTLKNIYKVLTQGITIVSICIEHDGNIHVWTDKCTKKEAIHISGNTVSKVGKLAYQLRNSNFKKYNFPSI